MEKSNKQITEGLNAWNRSVAFFQQFTGAFADIKLVYEGALESMNVREESDAVNNKAAKELAGVKAEKEELESSLPSLRNQQAAEASKLKDLRAANVRELEAHDVNLKARQEKLSALESAIDERAGVLGNLIARELT